MTNVWYFAADPETGGRFERPLPNPDAGKGPSSPSPHCRILNRRQVFALSLFARHMKGSAYPVARLKLTLEDFDADYFEFEANMFVSERLRQVMALDPSGVRYFEVDSKLSAPLPRSKNYQIMGPIAFEDVLESETADDHLDRRYVPPDSEIKFVQTRPGANPAHQLFYDNQYSGHLACTDALALRVLASGCTGVRFFDLHYWFRGKRFFRSLQGIEELIDRYRTNQADTTRFVRVIA